MTLGKVSHFNAFFLKAMWRLFGLLFPLCGSKLWEDNHILSVRRIGSVISKWLMSVAIKFSSRAPVR